MDMKAIVYTRYGSPDVLQFKEVEKPVPTEGQILVKIYAASANPLDWHLMRASPFLARLAGGLRKPKDPRLGADFAGRVEAVGANVTQFQPGDEVFGASTGAFAEYLCVAESQVALKPANLSFEQAAAVAVAATTCAGYLGYPFQKKRVVLPLDMVDKSISPFQTHLGPFFVMRYSRQVFSSRSEAPSEFFCEHLHQTPFVMTFQPHRVSVALKWKLAAVGKRAPHKPSIVGWFFPLPLQASDTDSVAPDVCLLARGCTSTTRSDSCGHTKW